MASGPDPAASRRPAEPDAIELLVAIDREQADAEIARMRHASEQLGRSLSRVEALELLGTRLRNVLAVYLDTAGMPSAGEAADAFRPFTAAELRAAAGDVAGGRGDDVHDAPDIAVELLLDEFAAGSAARDLDPAQVLGLGIRIGLVAAERRRIPF